MREKEYLRQRYAAFPLGPLGGNPRHVSRPAEIHRGYYQSAQARQG